MMKLLLATTNKGKIDEYRYLFRGLPFILVSPVEEGIDIDVDEKYSTFEENARHKAVEYALHSGMLTVADDSGLEVDALNGEPGVMSARYAGEGATDDDRVKYLLNKLEGVPWEKRTAHFTCVIGIADRKGIAETCTGHCHGIIAMEPAGLNGFGYDPLFYLPEFEKTLAELTSEIKNNVSHRADAARKARPFLNRLAGAGVQ
jgi:XTP/dITP diphosphohydrolase